VAGGVALCLDGDAAAGEFLLVDRDDVDAAVVAGTGLADVVELGDRPEKQEDEVETASSSGRSMSTIISWAAGL